MHIWKYVPHEWKTPDVVHKQGEVLYQFLLHVTFVCPLLIQTVNSDIFRHRLK